MKFRPRLYLQLAVLVGLGALVASVGYGSIVPEGGAVTPDQSAAGSWAALQAFSLLILAVMLTGIVDKREVWRLRQRLHELTRRHEWQPLADQT